jgi:hypothetical protein
MKTLGRDQINVAGSPGAILASVSGDVKQYFPTQTNIVINQALRSVRPPYSAAILRMVEDYEAIFGGRDAELLALDAFLADDKPYALLLAPTGRGSKCC